MARTLLGLILITAACTDPASEPIQSQTSSALTRVQAGRLLEQMTFGARPFDAANPNALDTIDHVVDRGIGNSVNDQLDVPTGTFAPTPPHTGTCDAPFDPALDLGAQFFTAALTAPDQLRLRTMFALHQILVVSDLGINENKNTCNSEKREAMQRYLNALRTGAFSNYRDLLETIALEPAMGNYLDMANNVAFDKDGNRVASDENFARELLQLFTLGPSLLRENGTTINDAQGNPKPAYSEANVQAFARTFTGWTYAGEPCPTIGGKNPANYTAPMIPCNVNHDDRTAQLLKYAGVVNSGQTTAGASARTHLGEALDNVFSHPNLPPFVCKQLIQHLVTSNPSATYVTNCVAVFKDDNSTAHRRGNLRAVVRAILLDDEARPATPAATAGRLRAPAELLARMLRSYGAALDNSLGAGPYLNSQSGALGQNVPRAPSVFSYYSPNQPLPGDTTGLYGPEFGVLDTGTIAGRANMMNTLLMGTAFATHGVTFDLTAIPGTTAELIDWIDQNWLSGAMSADLRATLTATLNDSAANTDAKRRQLAFYLVALSPEFEIQR